MLTNTLCYPSNCNCLYTSQQSLLVSIPLNDQVWLLDKGAPSNAPTVNCGRSVESDMVTGLVGDLVSILTTLAICTGQFQGLILDVMCCSWVFKLSRESPIGFMLCIKNVKPTNKSS